MVPNFFHFTIVEATVLVETLRAFISLSLCQPHHNVILESSLNFMTLQYRVNCGTIYRVCLFILWPINWPFATGGLRTHLTDDESQCDFGHFGHFGV